MIFDTMVTYIARTLPCRATIINLEWEWSPEVAR